MESVEYRNVAPTSLVAHPRNAGIYGEGEDVSELVELISRSGWVKPLVVNNSGRIISGHRRWKAAIELKLESIPVEVRGFSDELMELESLLLENASRIKTIEQKVREGEAWKEIEQNRAKQRQQQAAAATNHKLGRKSDKTLRENFHTASSGRITDAIAHRVGLGSGRTYFKAALVVEQIDALLESGDTQQAQMLRQALNSKSVDAAHQLVRKTKSSQVSDTTGNDADTERVTNSNSINKFAIGDWVEINQQAVSFKGYIGMRGRVEQVLAVEQQVSVNLDNGGSKLRFYPQELDLIAKAPPPCPYKVGDIVEVEIDRKDVASPQDRKWNGFWGKIHSLGELGTVIVDVGRYRLQLLPRDLKPIDAPTAELQDVVERVLRLRTLDLDEIEAKMLDFLQQREWFTSRQMDYLELIERFAV